MLLWESEDDRASFSLEGLLLNRATGNGLVFLSFVVPLRLQRALSRKGSNRMERRGGGGDEQEQEDLAKKLVIKGNSFLILNEMAYIPFVNRALAVLCSCAVSTGAAAPGSEQGSGGSTLHTCSC